MTASTLVSHFWLSFSATGRRCAWRACPCRPDHGPDLLGQQAQRDALGRERQGGMDMQAPDGPGSQRPQAAGRRMGGPVQLRRILHRQDQRHGSQPGSGRLDMAGQEVLGVDSVVVKKAIRRFELGTAPQASGNEAVGRCASTVASSSKRWVRRASPKSASANSVTAQDSSSGIVGMGHLTSDSPHLCTGLSGVSLLLRAPRLPNPPRKEKMWVMPSPPGEG